LPFPEGSRVIDPALRDGSGSQAKPAGRAADGNLFARCTFEKILLILFRRVRRLFLLNENR